MISILEARTRIRLKKLMTDVVVAVTVIIAVLVAVAGVVAVAVGNDSLVDLSRC